MPKVTVKFFAQVEDIAGCRELCLEVSPDLEAALSEIEIQTGGVDLRRKIDREFSLLCNGRHVRLDDQELRLKDGDQLAFVPRAVGG